MKKLLFWFMLLFSIVGFAQNHFLSTLLDKVNDRNIKVIQLPDESNDFFSSPSFETTNRIQYSTIIGRTFKISYSYPFNNKNGEERQLIVLESVGNNPETIYYNYNQYKYLLLPFKFVDEKGLDINTNDLCEGVEVEIDKYTNEKKTQSETIDEVSFIRYSNKGKSSQYVSIYAYGPTVVVDGKGLIILFESGKKIIRTNEKISVDVSSNLYNPYRYSVFFTPTVTEIQLLKKEVIVGAKLYIFESNVNEGEKLKKYANCVLIIPKVKK